MAKLTTGVALESMFMTAVVLRRRSDSRTGHVAKVGDVLAASPPRRYVRVVGIAVLVVAQCRRRSCSCCCRVCRGGSGRTWPQTTDCAHLTFGARFFATRLMAVVVRCTPSC